MKKKLSHSILYFPTSFEHRPVFEGVYLKIEKQRETNNHSPERKLLDNHTANTDPSRF